MATDEANIQKYGLIYGLNDRPPLLRSIIAGIQHALTSFAGIIVPPLLIVIGLGDAVPALWGELGYLVSMALIISGIASIIQAKTIPLGRAGQIGSGLLSVQGTSFIFISPFIGIGLTLAATGSSADQILGTMFTIALLASFFEVGFSFVIERLRSIITSTVSGLVITAIGITLVIQSSAFNLGGGGGISDYGSWKHLLLGLLVVAFIIGINLFRVPLLARMASVIVGLLFGFVLGLIFGVVDFSGYSAAGTFGPFNIPIPFFIKYGVGFDLTTFIVVGFLYVITAVEAVGDITATSMLTREPTEGPTYWRRVKGGVLGDGLNSALASLFGAFPNTTYSENNGVIQLTGVASRSIVVFFGATLIILGLISGVGNAVQLIPSAAIGGATLVLFGAITVAGIRLIAKDGLGQRQMLIIAPSLGIALAFGFGFGLTDQSPVWLGNILREVPVMAGLVAIAMTFILNSLDKLNLSPKRAD